MIRSHKGESHCLFDLPSGLSSLVPLFTSPMAPLFADIRLHWQSLPPWSSHRTSPLPCHHPYRFFLAVSLPLIFHFGLTSSFYYLCLVLIHGLQWCNFQVEGEGGAVLLWVAEGRGRRRKHCGCLAMDTLKPQTTEATYSSRAYDICQLTIWRPIKRKMHSLWRALRRAKYYFFSGKKWIIKM